ncbi:Uncharacterised protein [Klebsiella pneumoniae]|nr:Uncharacterised protein [Klebsiella pneumoniae]
MSAFTSLDRSLCCFRVTNFPDTDDLRVSAHCGAKPICKTCDVTSYLSLMRRQKVVGAAENVLYWIFVGHNFAIGLCVLAVAIQRRLQR